MTYFLTGFALSFGEGNGFCGFQYFALIDLPDEMMAQCFFQYTFAAVASCVPSGVVHERSSTLVSKSIRRRNLGLDMALHNQKAYRRHCDSKREKSTGY